MNNKWHLTHSTRIVYHPITSKFSPPGQVWEGDCNLSSSLGEKTSHTHIQFTSHNSQLAFNVGPGRVFSPFFSFWIDIWILKNTMQFLIFIVPLIWQLPFVSLIFLCLLCFFCTIYCYRMESTLKQKIYALHLFWATVCFPPIHSS